MAEFHTCFHLILVFKLNFNNNKFYILLIVLNKAAAEQTTIKNGMKMIESATCIRFYPRTSADSIYLNIISGSGCYSSVSTINLYLSPLCFRASILLVNSNMHS